MIISILNFIISHSPVFYLTQSVWRDEAFSYFMARPGTIKIIAATANDFNPPLYYILLHFWMYLAGHSEVFLRLLSFIFHLTGVYYIHLLGRKLSGKRFALFLALFYLFNPMLLYFAFEMRMYSLYALTTTATLYYFYSKDWKRYTIANILGLYTHSFFILINISLAAYLFISKKTRKNIFRTLFPVLFFLPWIPILIIQFIKSKQSWLYPVDWQLIKSVLGNLFLAYEGTPGHLWKFTARLSAVIILLMYLSLKKRKIKPGIFVLPVFIPLILILSYSILRRPVYVHRYLIFITVFEIISVALGVAAIPNKKIRKLMAFFCILFVIYFNFYITPFRKKTDFKSTFSEINRMANEGDYAYTMTPIAFLESAFYFKNPGKTFVYNPKKIHIPDYIGVNVVFPDISKTDFPTGPSRVFLIKDDASFEVVIQQ
ncbi:hypothetical protein A3E42_04450 [Candidatus Gottesmanbacteria bacterium RIFCSPHIGHO2_12_FULL_40_13]|uniref:Glycosyltransferase RgtA/B/C/D-like domain-containing protein n=1 Tax=Candidatus Gottesmanbacteria bacterium RIFCSPHIGHO2_01_FULL_40_15 TaxID=1798376 RepID=A0A1F5Z6X6_9BACT|nr:MAG: hypothetical protein A2777_01935 [Candidatus Gottesmanbacteria bacterium RIFCSPHIGHO2_01_FULL_40_15]OGG25561.1 MAG: hypothetical protein A3E42_04450 [Candidatus Gottesmanbacteria bacterium RIFCSPHIGHO2_12_FULL_40_13]